MSQYTDGSYLKRNPDWHVEDAPWKARQVLTMLEKHQLRPGSVCEVGCGSGEILRQLQIAMPKSTYRGYEVSPQAYELCLQRANRQLHFELKDFLVDTRRFDLILLMDVIEHIEDYYAFLRKIRQRGAYKIFHFPLDLSVINVLRRRHLLGKREDVGHIHYFNKNIIFQILRDLEYEVIDWFYTPDSQELQTDSIRARMMRLPRRLLFYIHNDWTVHMVGGYSLMVLAR